jgi:hypothetical protein
VAPAGRRASRRTAITPHYYTTTFSAKKNGDGDVESLLDLMTFMPPAISFVSIMFLM